MLSLRSKLISLTILFISVSLNATVVNPIGTWMISSIKQQPFNLASSIGYSIILKFNSDGSIDKIDYRTKKVSPTKNVWSIHDKKTINIELQTSGNFIAKFVLKSSLNDYLEVEKELEDDCLLMNSKHGNSSVLVKMCKIKEF